MRDSERDNKAEQVLELKRIHDQVEREIHRLEKEQAEEQSL